MNDANANKPATKGDVAAVANDLADLTDITNQAFNKVPTKDDLKTVAKDVKELKVDVKGLKVDVKDLKVDVKDLKVDVKELKVDVKGLKVDVKKNKTTLERVLNIVESIDQNTRGLPAKVERLHKKVFPHR